VVHRSALRTVQLVLNSNSGSAYPGGHQLRDGVWQTSAAFYAGASSEKCSQYVRDHRRVRIWVSRLDQN
ncbi:hypothetical protein N9087_01535, partial [bacterium]|nr:hypothetical protein [bacterium]